ncbi:hypothetical protein SAMN05444166_5530 [Singulisphaera sp. GP187]|uniref:hypothetical protein n=1 Tax=Singulisphaera sp. GP187 TaxID=1882752 RepID=UPI00092C92D2|nr:hypothetical protein [Singulisphaera sp. GP187]SIO57946.1 hypothetical protein SAMN05444166_5530 [Singulisphaera sp. GP187]
MTRESPLHRTEANERHRGPNPGAVALVFTALFLASLIPVTGLVSEPHFPSPLQPAGEIVTYFQSESAKVRLCAFLQFGSSIPLGIFTATMVSRLRYHGDEAAGATIALFGGLSASFFVALSALVQWTIGQPGIADSASLARALYFLLVATGGVGYSVPLGLLIAGISIPAAFLRLLPRWLVMLGLIVGVIGELSSLSLIIPQALFLIPLTRFPGFFWLIAAGFKLPRSRPGESGRA